MDNKKSFNQQKQCAAACWQLALSLRLFTNQLKKKSVGHVSMGKDGFPPYQKL